MKKATETLTTITVWIVLLGITLATLTGVSYLIFQVLKNIYKTIA